MTDVLEQAWDLVRSDLGAHPLGAEVYLSVRGAILGEMMTMGMTEEQVAGLRVVTIGVRNGDEVCRGVPADETAGALNRAVAVLADCLQDVIEESSHEAWPRCPRHGVSATVSSSGGAAAWRCPWGDWAVPVGALGASSSGATDPEPGGR